MTNEEAMAEAKRIISETAEDCRPMVEKIESSIPTTLYHYGRYLAILSQCDNDIERKALALGLLEAGANTPGVMWAMRLLNEDF